MGRFMDQVDEDEPGSASPKLSGSHGYEVRACSEPVLVPSLSWHGDASTSACVVRVRWGGGCCADGWQRRVAPHAARQERLQLTPDLATQYVVLCLSSLTT